MRVKPVSIELFFLEALPGYANSVVINLEHICLDLDWCQ